MLYVGEGSEREQCCLLSSCHTFSHFPHFPQANSALSDAALVLISHMGGLVVRSRTLWAPSTDSPVRLAVFPAAIPTCFYRQMFSNFLLQSWNPGLCGLSGSPIFPPGLSGCEWDCPIHQPPPCPPSLSAATLFTGPHHLGCPPPPLLPVWMNVSSLTPWLSDFYSLIF